MSYLLWRVFVVVRYIIQLALDDDQNTTDTAYRNSLFNRSIMTSGLEVVLSSMVYFASDVYEINHMNCGNEIKWRLILAVMNAIICILHFHGNIWTYNWPAPNVSGFIAQLVRASHQYREVTGSNPVEVLNFFSGFFTQLHIIAFITARINLHLIVYFVI